MTGRAELAEAESPSSEIVQGLQAGIVRPLRDEIADGVKARTFMALRADDPQRSLAGEIVDAGA